MPSAESLLLDKHTYFLDHEIQTFERGFIGNDTNGSQGSGYIASNSKFELNETKGCMMIKKMLRSKDKIPEGEKMSRALSFDKLVSMVHDRLEQLPDHRQGGNNTTYAIKDAALGALAVFFTQSPSFLAYQKQMEENKGQSNATTLFGIERTPSTPQIRNLLDPVPAPELSPLFGDILEALAEQGELAQFRAFNESLLVPLDGTQYFSSQKIHCDQCSHHQLNNGQTLYSHKVVTAVVVNPDLAHVLPLEPEFIQPQDGHDKQDCEIAAAKRWLNRSGRRYAAYNVTLLGDDLYAHQPFCQQVLQNKLNFIFVCKPDSHPKLYEWLDFLQAKPDEALPTLTRRHWNGQFAEIWTYRYINHVPLRAGPDALEVNWCELTISREDTGQPLYLNSWVTNYQINEDNLVALAQAGRARWKTENEGNNILKHRGYHLEHNFGHGHQHLSATLLTLNLLAFFFHTILHLIDTRYQRLRQHLGARRTFFNDIRTLTRYLCFDSWHHLLNFMIDQLELDIPPAPT